MPYGITQCHLPPGRGDIPAWYIEVRTHLRQTEVIFTGRDHSKTDHNARINGSDKSSAYSAVYCACVASSSRKALEWRTLLVSIKTTLVLPSADMLSDRLVDVHSLRQSVCPLCKIQGAAMHGPTVGRMLLINASVLVACRKRKCADTTGTVPVPWSGHFQS